MGQFVAGLLGMAWSITTYFVIPVLVVEKKNPFEAMKRSVGILRKTWGESLVANFGIGLIVFLLIIPIFGLIAGGFFMIGSVNAVIGRYHDRNWICLHLTRFTGLFSHSFNPDCRDLPFRSGRRSP